MAEVAERRLTGTGWLPELLRSGAVVEAEAVEAEARQAA